MLWSRFGYSLIIKRQSKTFLEKFWLSLTRKSLFSGIPILPWCKKLKMKQNDIRFIAHNDAKIKKVVGTHFASIEMHRTHAQVTNKIGICKLQLHIESHALLPCNTECLEFQSKLKNCLSMIAWWSLFAKNCGNVCKSVNVRKFPTSAHVQNGFNVWVWASASRCNQTFTHTMLHYNLHLVILKSRVLHSVLLCTL